MEFLEDHDLPNLQSMCDKLISIFVIDDSNNGDFDGGVMEGGVSFTLS